MTALVALMGANTVSAGVISYSFTSNNTLVIGSRPDGDIPDGTMFGTNGLALNIAAGSITASPFDSNAGVPSGADFGLVWAWDGDAVSTKPAKPIVVSADPAKLTSAGVLKPLIEGTTIDATLNTPSTNDGALLFPNDLLTALINLEDSYAGKIYFGFSFQPADTPLYGWMDLSFNGTFSADPLSFIPDDIEGLAAAFTATSVTVNGWAYEDSGAGIITPSSVPEPASTAVLAAGAALLAGSAQMLRRRRRGLAQVA